MKCIVVDDERIAREGLNEFIREFDFLEPIDNYGNPHALHKLKKDAVDLIFLDIQMPFLNGLEFAETLKDLGTMIIFTTAHPEFALKGYKVNAIEYLLKPIFFEDFKVAVYKAKRLYELMHKKENSLSPLLFKENGFFYKIYPHQILYISALQNYIEIYRENEDKMVIHQTLKNILEELPSGDFLQIHKSYIVNLKYFKRIQDSTMVIENIELPIARSRKNYVLSYIKNYFEN
ncbi:LytR/AlgR family response regulator transcription factor [Mesonia maritima]|uniref:DNA-binding LytR/AlgR family response regulator n=1 Tax=Mesonia maritima TaxID=1793873 RepID=A0ABU1K9D0_9FLAO|nr:LytTR family DNA-binding domain-containing protein [Mesonia maritima]MDR6301911.1 DNA-binding LytR/AlgR family response regulator [Mesonia maritima]